MNKKTGIVMKISLMLCFSLIMMASVAYGVDNIELVQTWESGPLGGEVMGLASGDVDGDGREELVAATGLEGYLHLFKFDGKDYAAQAKLMVGSAVLFPRIGDLDNDGKKEVLIVDNLGMFRSYQWNGTTLEQDYAGRLCQEQITCLEVGDIDQDGNNELMVGTEQGGVRIYRWVNSSLTETGKITLQQGINHLSGGDFAGDGKFHLAVSANDGIVRIYSWDGNSYALTWQTTALGRIETMAADDLDHNGKAELLFGNNWGYLYLYGVQEGELVRIWQSEYLTMPITSLIPGLLAGKTEKSIVASGPNGIFLFIPQDGVYQRVWQGSYKSAITCLEAGRLQNNGQDVIALGLAEGVAVFTPPQPWFADVRNHWARDRITALLGRGVIQGYPDRTFRPEQKLSRAEAATILARAFNLPLETPAQPSFRDVPITNWAYPYIEAAKKAKWLQGYQDGTFRPEAPIKRAEMLVLCLRSAGISPQEGTNLKFTDAAEVPDWAKGYVAAAVDQGLVRGYNDGSFHPVAACTRAEAVTLIEKTLGALDQ